MTIRRILLVSIAIPALVTSCGPEAELPPASPATEVSAPASQDTSTGLRTSSFFENPHATVADYLACLRAEDIMLISAHRGGPLPGYPENAIETLENTLAHGPMLIETDVRTTADGVFVLLHDEDLERTTTGSGLLSETTYADLQDVRLRDNRGRVTDFSIPTLEEAVGWAQERAILQLDVKRGTPIDSVVEMVAAWDALPHALVIAYTTDDALRASNAHPDATVSVSIYDRGRLDSLERQGMNLDRITAWTGTEAEDPDLWSALNARNISAAWGSFRTLDDEVERTGDTTQFARLADEGLDILSSDLHKQAFDAVEMRQNTRAALARCNG